MKTLVHVSNFMKIESATIDISNFAIFVGENNTGKTKLMELIYGVLSEVYTFSIEKRYQFKDNRIHYDDERMSELLDSFNDYLSSNKEIIIHNIFGNNISIDDIVLSITDFNCFFDVYLVENGEIAPLPLDLQNKLIHDYDFLFIDKEYPYFVIVKTDKNTKKSDIFGIYRFISTLPRSSIVKRINKEILLFLFGFNGFEKNDQLFLPASRMGLSILYKDYFKGRGKSTYVADGIQTQFGHGYVTKPMADYLTFLLQYTYSVDQARKNKRLVDFISKNIIDGNLQEEKDETLYKPDVQDIEIPLFLASSMINEMDPVVKLLTNRRPYSLVYYDEVETSLHPLKQLQVVRLLNRMNNSGIRLMISTHSDTFAIKINNLLLLKELMKNKTRNMNKLLKKLGLSQEDLLKVDDIHIYQFNNTDYGTSTVKELEFKRTPLFGYSFELFDEKSESLFKEFKTVLGEE